MRTILLTGMSGVGKSAVLHRLAGQEVLCVDLDDGWMREADGERLIDVSAVRQFMHSHSAQPIVLAGCAMNQGELDVDCTILLTASAQTMLARIADRENPFGKDEASWRKILADKEEFEPILRARCDLVIDTEQPLDVTVRQVGRLLKEDFNMRRTRFLCK